MRDELSLLEAQLTYKKRLEAMANELREQRAVLQQKVALLEQKMILEKKDVERLEGKSLAAFYYHAFGKMNEKLEGERREYYAARVKYDAAVRELKAVELDLECTEEDLLDLRDCEPFAPFIAIGTLMSYFLAHTFWPLSSYSAFSCANVSFVGIIGTSEEVTLWELWRKNGAFIRQKQKQYNKWQARQDYQRLRLKF